MKGYPKKAWETKRILYILAMVFSSVMCAILSVMALKKMILEGPFSLKGHPLLLEFLWLSAFSVVSGFIGWRFVGGEEDKGASSLEIRFIQVFGVIILISEIGKTYQQGSEFTEPNAFFISIPMILCKVFLNSAWETERILIILATVTSSVICGFLSLMTWAAMVKEGSFTLNGHSLLIPSLIIAPIGVACGFTAKLLARRKDAESILFTLPLWFQHVVGVFFLINAGYLTYEQGGLLSDFPKTLICFGMAMFWIPWFVDGIGSFVASILILLVVSVFLLNSTGYLTYEQFGQFSDFSRYLINMGMIYVFLIFWINWESSDLPSARPTSEVPISLKPEVLPSPLVDSEPFPGPKSPQ